MLCIVTKNHVWGVKVQNASSHKSIYSFKSSVRYFPEICILTFVLIAELTRLALPGQNDQFPWPVKTALSRNVAMGSKSYSQSRMKSSGSSERMITTDWQSLELTRLALPGQNDQFPWPEKNSVEPKRCDGKQWIFKGKIAFFLVFIMLAMEIM